MHKLAHQLGSFLAKVQSFIDNVFHFVFKAIRFYGNKSSKPNSNKSNSKLVQLISKLFSFVGEAGDSYFQEYENIKSKQRKD